MGAISTILVLLFLGPILGSPTLEPRVELEEVPENPPNSIVAAAPIDPWVEFDYASEILGGETIEVSFRIYGTLTGQWEFFDSYGLDPVRPENNGGVGITNSWSGAAPNFDGAYDLFFRLHTDSGIYTETLQLLVSGQGVVFQENQLHFGLWGENLEYATTQISAQNFDEVPHEIFLNFSPMYNSAGVPLPLIGRLFVVVNAGEPLLVSNQFQSIGFVDAESSMVMTFGMPQIDAMPSGLYGGTYELSFE